MNKKQIYTIGHSNHSMEYFLELLSEYRINCIVDVRSVPASNYNQHFNKEYLQSILKEKQIVYMHFGEEFGARHTEPEVLDSIGKVDFDKVRKTQKFLNGVDRLRHGLNKGYNISLMCSEADPFECHRFSMISYYLVRNGFHVDHILKDKSIVNNSTLEIKLLEKYKKQIPSTNLFEVFTKEQQLNLAYRLRNQDVAYDTMRY